MQDIPTQDIGAFRDRLLRPSEQLLDANTAEAKACGLIAKSLFDVSDPIFVELYERAEAYPHTIAVALRIIKKATLEFLYPNTYMDFHD